ncbi:T9SS type A sorting domain-containing protein [Flavobacterium profundi]|nr:T9SS type A sorting domain-containing protein [Flavobacterium profundi]
MKKYIIILNLIAISFVQAQTELLINKNWEIQQYYSILTQSPDDRIVHYSIDNTEITYPDYTGLVYRFNENNNYQAYFNVTPSEITESTWSFGSNNALIINGRTYEILELTNEKLLISFSSFFIDTPTIQEFPLTNYYEFKNMSTLSLEENVLASNYHFFPNPVKKNLYFTYNEDNNAHKIEIYSIDGKKVLTFPLEKVGKEQEVSLESLKQGVYLLKLYDNSNRILQVSKLLKD